LHHRLRFSTTNNRHRAAIVIDHRAAIVIDPLEKTQFQSVVHYIFGCSSRFAVFQEG
jgi:hypothetical protein